MRNLLALKSCVLFASLSGVINCAMAYGQDQELLTPLSCTGISRPANDDSSRKSSAEESPDHREIAYIVQTPDVANNANETLLYVKRSNEKDDSVSKPILMNPRIAGIRWLPDSQRIVALIQAGGKNVLAEINTQTSSYSVVSDPNEDVEDYSIDRDGGVIAVAVKVTNPHNVQPVDSAAVEHGYRVSATASGYADPPRMRAIFLFLREQNRMWKKVGPVTFTSPLNGKEMASFRVGGGMDISVSPDGQQLLFDSIENLDDLPERWESSAYVSTLKERWGFILIDYLYNIRTGHVSIPIESPVVRRHAIWSPDSQSFARIAVPPIGSIWEKEDIGKGALSDHNTRLFAVNIRTGAVTSVKDRAEIAPLSWTDDGNLVVRGQEGEIQALKKVGDRWIVASSFTIPLQGLAPYSRLSTDGVRFIGFYESASTAPELFEYDRVTGNVSVMAKLNPHVDTMIFPQIRNIVWNTATGYEAHGVLLLPPNYDPKHRYPLVIENGSILYDGSFVCDSGASHVSSFVRGMLADQGIIYLMRMSPGNEQWETSFYPKGYPGEIAEAAFHLDLVESAVQYLNDQEMIDPTKVGLIGFSRGGWYTEYALVHSKIRFRAATVTDNVDYGYGAYWYFHSPSMQHSYDAMYGGPPYGKTLDNWKKYSISFNTEKIRTPVLQEVMGYGLKDDDPQRPPNNLASFFELFTALERQNKPVEMFYYPDEEHQVEHPVARMWSLQRNIDWFRFWLQGYERANPEDTDQYRRWEHLRELRDADAKATEN
jgi:dipeptidyl aminopeptidase/acylaminoacyl peptidase